MVTEILNQLTQIADLKNSVLLVHSGLISSK